MTARKIRVKVSFMNSGNRNKRTGSCNINNEQRHKEHKDIKKLNFLLNRLT